MTISHGLKNKKRFGDSYSSKATKKKKDEEVESDIDENDLDFSDSDTEKGAVFFNDLDNEQLNLAKKYLLKVGYGSIPAQEVEQKLLDEAKLKNNKHPRTVDYQNLKINRKSTFLKGHRDGVTCVALSELNPSRVFTGSKDCSIIVWNIETGQKTVLPGRRKEVKSDGGHFSQCLDVACISSGEMLCSVGRDEILRIWDIRASTKKCMMELLGHRGPITGVSFDSLDDTSFSLNQDIVFTTSVDKSLKQWNLKAQKCVETLYGHVANPNCIDLLVKNRPCTGGDDCTMRMWKLQTGTHLIYENHTQPVDTVNQLDGFWTLSGSQDGSISIWSISKRKPVITLHDAHQKRWITALGCIRYSNFFFSGSDDGYIRCWKIKARNEAVVEHQQHADIPIKGVITQISLSSKNKLGVAAVSSEHRLGRWESVREASNGLLIFHYDVNE